MVIIIVLACLIPIIMCIWVHGDAKKRGMDETLWLLIVLLTGILGLIIYLIVRDPLKPEYSGQQAATAPSTHTAQPQHAATRPISSDVKYCPNCGGENESSVSFCIHCGANVQNR